MYQVCNVGSDCPSFVDERAVSAEYCIAEREASLMRGGSLPFEFVRDAWGLVEGPGCGIASTCSRVGSRRKKSVITCCICGCELRVNELPEGFEGSVSVAGGWM